MTIHYNILELASRHDYPAAYTERLYSIAPAIATVLCFLATLFHSDRHEEFVYIIRSGRYLLK